MSRTIWKSRHKLRNTKTVVVRLLHGQMKPDLNSPNQILFKFYYNIPIFKKLPFLIGYSKEPDTTPNLTLRQYILNERKFTRLPELHMATKNGWQEATNSI